MSSGRVTDYLGEGLAAARPESLDLHPGSIGFWRSTDSGAISVWSDESWHDVGGAGPLSYTIVTEAAEFTAAPEAHAGLATYIRAGGNVIFNAGQGYAAGQVFSIRATATVALTGVGVTLRPPHGGTLNLQSGMAVQVVMTSPTAADVIGQTVSA